MGLELGDKSDCGLKLGPESPTEFFLCGVNVAQPGSLQTEQGSPFPIMRLDWTRSVQGEWSRSLFVVGAGRTARCLRLARPPSTKADWAGRFWNRTLQGCSTEPSGHRGSS